MTTEEPSALLELTARIVSAQCSSAPVPAEALPGLIRQVFQALSNIETPAAPEAEKPTPAVPVKRSVFPDYIVCLEDGKKLKMLKRHLQSAYNMTPAQYRERWGLPPEYPMVAPNYAERRSLLAKQIGLGRKDGTDADQGSEDEPKTPEVQVIPERKRGRRKAARKGI